MDEEAKEIRRCLAETKRLEADCEKNVEDARKDVEDQESYIQQLEAQLEVEREGKKRLLDRVRLHESARAALTIAKERLEVLLTEAEAPRVPDVEPAKVLNPSIANVTPIRKVEEKAAAIVGIGAAVKRSKARKRKEDPEREKRERLKSTHVTGVMGFAGAEKPPHL